MTTAAKYGAQDLNGNPFSYQQIVAPVSSNNIVVNATFANRNGADAKVRLAETSVPLVSQSVASTQGLFPFAATASANSMIIPTAQALTVTGTSFGSNLITTASYAVFSTMVNTNIITCVATKSFNLGAPVVFVGSLGNLISGNIYYVLTINSATTFTVSTSLGGIPFALTTATGTILVQETVTNLVINEPIMFSGTGFGGITSGLSYYVLTIAGMTSFTISTFPSGPPVSMFTATGNLSVGYNPMVSTLNLSSTAVGTNVKTLQTLTISTAAVGTNVFTSASIAVTATTLSTNLITSASTATLTVGQPVVFTGSLGNLVSGTLYYVRSVISSTQFTVSSIIGGVAVILTTASGNIVVQQSTTNLAVNQPIVFNGTAFGGVVSGVNYYISAISSDTTFTVSSVPGGSVFQLYTASGNMVLGTASLPATLSIVNTAATSMLGTVAVTATTTGTNLITAATTSSLAIGQPIVFSSAIGNLLVGTTYYVLAIPTLTTFSVSAYVSGLEFPLSDAIGNVTLSTQQSLNIASATTGSNQLTTAVVQTTNTTVTTNLITVVSTAGFYVGMPVVFAGTVFGNIVANQLYYILTVNSSTTFAVSININGPVLVLSTASGSLLTVQQSTTDVGVNQPVVFSSSTPVQTYNIASTTTGTNVVTTLAIPITATTTGTNVITTTDTTSLFIGQPVVFNGSLGNLIASTIYYVQSIPNSTQFTVSATFSGVVFALATAAGSINYQEATTNLIVNELVTFSGSVYGNLIAGTNYYIQSVVSNTSFTVSSTVNGSITSLATATGVMVASVTIPTYSLTLGNTTVGTNVITNSIVAVTATAVATNLVTMSSTATLTVGQPIVFSGTAFGNIVAGTIYYIQAIPSSTQLAISATLNGEIFVLSTASGTMSVSGATTGLVLNQPIVFAGTTFGNIIAGAIYYIQSVPTAQTFTVSIMPGGSAFALVTATGTMTSSMPIFGGVSANITYYVNSVVSNIAFTVSTTPGGSQFSLKSATGYMRVIVGPSVTANTNILTIGALAVTATTAVTNVITVANASTLAIGQAIVFNGNLGNLVTGTIYYVLTIPSTTTFTVSAISGGSIYSLATATGNITVSQSTAGLALNQPIIFASAALPLTIGNTTNTTNVVTSAIVAVTATTTGTNLITVTDTGTLVVGQPVVFSGSLGNLIGGTVYYVQGISKLTKFTVSTVVSGTVFELATATGSINVQHATSSLAINQPVVFSGSTFGNIVAGTTYYVQNIVSSTSFSVSTSINGTVIVLATASGTMSVNLSTVGGIIAGTTYYVQNITNATSFSISATYGGGPFILTNFNGLMTANVTAVVPVITISNTTVTTNVLTTASIAVSATTTGTNLITATSTLTLAIGQPVVFSGALGGLVANVSYYVLTINSITQFTVSSTFNGVVYSITTATGSITVSQSTAALVINQPIFFTGTGFGNLVTSTTYYVQSIVSSTQLSVSQSFGGSVFILTTATGTMAFGGPTQTMVASNTTITTNVITSQAITVSATAAGTNIITCASTYFMSVNMPVVFNSTYGGITSGVIYYVQSIPSSLTFTVSMLPNGPQAILSTAVTTSSVQQATTNLLLNQSIIFSGTTFGNIIAGTTYYVLNIVSSSTFTVSTVPGGSVFVLATATGLMPYSPMSTSVISINSITTTPIAISSTSTVTNLITCVSTSTLAIGQAVVFSGNLGNLLGNTIYYVLTIPSSTMFTVSIALYGTAVSLSSASGVINVQQSTSSLTIGQPIIFSSTLAPVTIANASSSGNVITLAAVTVTATTISTNTITASSTATLLVGQSVVFSESLGNLLANTIYYVQTIVNSTQFTVSLLLNGAVVSLVTASGSVTVAQSTTDWIINQPIVFTGTGFGNIVSGTTYYIHSVLSSTTFVISAGYNGTAFVLGTSGGTMTGTFVAFGGLTVNSIYYIQSIPSLTSIIVSNIIAAPNNGNANIVALTAGTGSLNATVISPVPSLPISATTVTTNVLTTSPITISVTAIGTNFITCNTTDVLVYGQPIVFTGTAFGNIVAGTIYYVLNIVNSTTFTMSTTYGGAVFALVTASGTLTMNPSTTNLVIGQPIVAFGAVFGNVVYSTTYYVNSIVSTTTFTVSVAQSIGYSGTALTLATSSGTMVMAYGPIQLPLVSNTTTTSNLLTVQSTIVTSTSYYGTNLIGCYNTYMLALGMPVTFGTTANGLVIGTIYYIASVPSATTFTVSAVLGGPTLSLTYGSSLSISMYQAVTNLWINQAISFSSNVSGSTVFGGIVAGMTYYVQSIPSLYTFTVSTQPFGAVYPLATAAYSSYQKPMSYTVGTLPIKVSNVFINQSFPIVGSSAAGNILTVGNLLTTGNIPIVITAASSTTNILTCTSTATLSVGLPIVFSSGFAGLTNGMTYYILSILNNTQFTIANSWGGQQAILNAQGVTSGSTTILTITGTNQTFTNSITTTGNTYSIYTGLPIVFTGTSFDSALVIGVTYYVLQVTSVTTFSVSATSGGTVLTLTGATGNMTMVSAAQLTNIGVTIQPSTANLTIGMPMYATGTTFGNILANATYYVNTILSPTTFTVTTTQYSAVAFTLTANFGYMTLMASTGQTGTGSTGTTSLIAAAPIIFTGATIIVTSCNGTLLTTTTGNTGVLVIDQALMFTGYTIGGIQPNVYYYVQSIPSFNTFTLSATVGGVAISWGTTSNIMTAQVVTSDSTAILPYNVYYVQSVQSPYTFSITPVIGGVATTVSTVNGAVIIQSNICTLSTGGSTAYLAANQLVTFTGVGFGNLQTFPVTNLPFIVTNTTITSNYVTVSNTATLLVNQPVVFLGTTWGGLTAFQTYYVLAVASNTQFTVSLTPGGTAVVLATIAAAAATPSFFMVSAYYVKAVVSNNQFVLSSTPGGNIQQLTSAYAIGGNVLLANGQPVFTDFLEYDALIAGTGVLERTGIIVPPNTYLYASSNISQVTALAIGIQEGV